MPGRVITVWFYAVEYDQCPGEWAVQRQVEWTICEDPSDPGGTEIWSTEAYGDVTAEVIDTQKEAGQAAREFAETALSQAQDYAGWDGEIFASRALGAAR